MSIFRGDVAMDDPRPQAREEGDGFTVIGIMEDGAEVSEVILELKTLGVGDENVVVLLKRPDPEEEEPFPEGTRYIVIPDNAAGLGFTIGFAIVFAVTALLFAFTTPQLGMIFFLFFISLAALLVVASFIKVGAMPILIDIEAPAEESGYWNDEFENGKVLLFAGAEDKRALRPVWDVFERKGLHFDVVDRKLEPQPVNEAVLHVARSEGSEKRVEEEL